MVLKNTALKNTALKNVALQLLVLLLLLPGVATTTSAAPDTTTIVILGDSLSAGYGIPQQDSWPQLLKNRLSALNQPYIVVNASISGDTTSGGLARIDRVLKQFKPNIVILELGSNDGLRGLPLSQMQFNLSSIIEKCQDIQTDVLLLGMRIPTNYGFNYTQKFHKSYSDIAGMYRIALVPFFLENVATERELMQGDNLHPKANAQPILLENIWPQLKKLLDKS